MSEKTETMGPLTEPVKTAKKFNVYVRAASWYCMEFTATSPEEARDKARSDINEGCSMDWKLVEDRDYGWEVDAVEEVIGVIL